jgi:IstB-like ATP binding protein/AcrB/AcrD/AcrF family protein
MSTDLLTQLKALHLYGMAQAWTEFRAEASQRKQVLSPEFTLSQLIKAEIADRQMRSLKYQLKVAKFPIHRDLVEFDWSETPLSRPQIEQLATAGFMDDAHNLILVGSIWLLAALGYNLSVAVVVGMIAMAGLSVELGLLMMLYLDLAWRRHAADGSLKTRTDLMNTIVEGASQRIRPMLMTSLTLFLGLLPIMYSSGSGADVMKRIAAPMLGGAGSTLILVLIVFPAIFSLWRGRSLSDLRPLPRNQQGVKSESPSR